MVSIRNIQSRDLIALSDAFPHQDESYFQELYVDHLQDKCVTVIAVHTVEDEAPQMLGLACLRWESSYTQFWRRNIPEITDVFVHTDHRQQGIASQLITTCEAAARAESYTTIGIRVEATDAGHSAYALYQKLGYADQSSTTDHHNLTKTFIE